MSLILNQLYTIIILLTYANMYLATARKLTLWNNRLCCYECGRPQGAVEGQF